MFTRDLELIDKLRADAINVREPHSSGVKKLTIYAAQLVCIGGKFPIDVSQARVLARIEHLERWAAGSGLSIFLIRLVPTSHGIPP
jgi:programmed cell death 6-interacting protein